ncbi:MAG TPA: hypothetical protein VGE97_01965, partial [Nitrososphaera sp.]
ALGTFRELKSLNKTFQHMAIQELSDNPKLIGELDKALRHGMPPESRFHLPYRIEERKKELIDNIAELYPVDRSGAKARAKIVTRHYKGPAGYQQFNYCLEAVMAPRTDAGDEKAGEVEILGNINSSPSIDGGARYFDSAAGVGYYWTDNRGRGRTATSLGELLSKCGFDTYVSVPKRRVPCVLYINLLTPCADWLGAAGKTHIDLKPYADDIARVVSSLAYKMPSYYGRGYSDYSYSSGGEKTYAARDYLKDFLSERYTAVSENPSLIKTDPLTQQSVFYRIRPRMIENHFVPKKNWGKTREYIVGIMRDECAFLGNDLGLDFTLTREHLGIHAGARAVMLYDGESYPITLYNIQELAKKGVAFIIIEKEGIADALAPFAKNYAVAIVNTRGIFVEAVKDLIEKVETPLGILTDYDAHGVAMARRTRKDEFRIGIDIGTIEWFQQQDYDIELEDVEEEYSPGIRTTDEYLANLRIELDSIVAKIGREPLWEYVAYRMEEQFKGKGFDYTKVIERPADAVIYPDIVVDLLTSLNIYLGRITEDAWRSIREELTGMKKLLPVSDKVNECTERFEEVVSEDKVIQQTLIPKVRKLLQELSVELHESQRT